MNDEYNRPFPSWLLLLCQDEPSCETIHMKMSSTYRFIFMQMKLIFKGKVCMRTIFETEVQGNCVTVVINYMIIPSSHNCDAITVTAE